VRSRVVAVIAALGLIGAACTQAPVEAIPPGPLASPVEVASASATPGPSPRPRPSPSPSAGPPAARIGDRVLVADRQYLTVIRAEEWRGRAPTPGARFIAALVKVEGVEAAPYNDTFFAVSAGAERKKTASAGKPPRFAYGNDLGPGKTYQAWVFEGDEVIPSATFEPTEEGALTEVLTGADAATGFAVTVEPDGGSPDGTPSSPAVMVFELTPV